MNPLSNPRAPQTAPSYQTTVLFGDARVVGLICWLPKPVESAEEAGSPPG